MSNQTESQRLRDAAKEAWEAERKARAALAAARDAACAAAWEAALEAAWVAERQAAEAAREAEGEK